MRKRILCTAVSAALLFSLTGCAAGDKPYVYYLNFKPEADAAWQQLAKEYTALTGVPVKIVTAASNSYSDTLAAQMNKTSPPTLFICGDSDEVRVSTLEKYRKTVKGARMAVVPCAGHVTSLEQWDAYSESIRAFLREYGL